MPSGAAQLQLNFVGADAVRENLLGTNPASELEPPRVGQSLPRNVLTREVKTILIVPDLDTDAGVRDRAILEILCGLERFVLDIGRAVVTVRGGKGNKDRIVPIGECAWTG